MRLTENKLLCGALVFLAALGVYANSVRGTFHWEDEYIVRDNVHIRTLRNIPAFFRPGYINVYESGQGQRYRPLRTVTLALDYAVWKDDARGYHLTNVLLHGAASVAGWGLCLAVSGNPGISLASGLLFAVHPAHAESVAWVKNRSDILCSVFYLLSGLLFALFLKNRRRALLALSVLALAPAFLAKEMAVTAPIAFTLLLLWENLSNGRRPEEGWYWLLPHYALLSLYLIFRQGVMSGESLFPGGIWSHLIFVAGTAGEYIRLLLWPVKLSIERAVPAGPMLGLDVSLALLAAAALVFFSFRRRQGALWLSLFLLLLLPVLNISYITGRPFAEQRVYLPSLAFMMFAAWAAAGLLGRVGVGRRWAAGLLAVLVLAAGGRTLARNSDWRSEVFLWEGTTVHAPTPRAFNNLAVAYLREKRYDEAVKAAGRSLELDPSFVDAYNTLGAAYHDIGLYDRSIGAFEKAVFFSGGGAYKSLMNLAALYSLRGRNGEALNIYAKVIKMAPWLDAAHYNMGLTLAAMGRDDEALKALAESLALNPYNPDAHRIMGRILEKRGDRAGAAKAYAALLSLEPSDVEAAAYLARGGAR